MNTLAIVEAATKSDLSALKQLVTRENARVLITTSLYSPFILCCGISNIECIKWFIDDLGVTNLFDGCYTACARRNMDAIRFFLRRYPHLLSDKVTNNNTMLHFAADFDYIVVKMLLDAKANVHLKNVNSYTPIAELLTHPGDSEDVAGFYQIARLMMEYGARLPDIDYIYDGLKFYQIELDGKRTKCQSAGIALLIALREKGVPKDLARYIIKCFVLSSWLNDVWK